MLHVLWGATYSAGGGSSTGGGGDYSTGGGGSSTGGGAPREQLATARAREPSRPTTMLEGAPRLADPAAPSADCPVRPRAHRRPHIGVVVVALAVGWNLWHLSAELLRVPYLNDSSMHEQMVRFATGRFETGHLPLTSWFPYLGLGSPQFLHYQSLPALLTGLLGVAIGPNQAFRWSLYLLLSLWPLSVYLAARLFGIGRSAAAISAALPPFLLSPVGVGYEQRAYIWARVRSVDSVVGLVHPAACVVSQLAGDRPWLRLLRRDRVRIGHGRAALRDRLSGGPCADPQRSSSTTRGMAATPSCSCSARSCSASRCLST